jgi:hypothetical protein
MGGALAMLFGRRDPTLLDDYIVSIETPKERTEVSV